MGREYSSSLYACDQAGRIISPFSTTAWSGQASERHSGWCSASALEGSWMATYSDPLLPVAGGF